MRKQTKVAVVVSAAALLAMGASMTSFAKGWTLEDNEWVYLDSEDERIYGEWKKSVDGNYYWLDEETGVMATNRLVEDEDDIYYVKGDGTRVVNDWVEVDNEDGESVGDATPDTLWYYFGSNGKAYKAGDNATDGKAKKTINGNTYFFDESGRMFSGWLEYDGKTYYCGTEEQGYAFKGWQYLETEPAAEANVVASGAHEDEEWFYFDGGKLVKAEDGEIKTKYIDGHYYGFDEDGVMVTGWIDDVIASAGIAGVGTDAQAYAASNGVMSSGWVKADKNDESKWFYMVTVRDENTDAAYRAVPFNSGADGYRAKSIDGKTYLFNEEGIMQTGKVDLLNDKEFAEGDYDGVSYKTLEDGIYYFEKEGSNMGAMKTGKVTITEDGEEFNYYFSNEGAVINGLKDNVIYGDDGVRIQAEDGNSYEIVTLDQPIYKVDSKGKRVKDANNNDVVAIQKDSKVVVSSTGKIRTSKTVTIDGEKYAISINKETGVYGVSRVVED